MKGNITLLCKTQGLETQSVWQEFSSFKTFFKDNVKYLSQSGVQDWCNRHHIQGSIWEQFQVHLLGRIWDDQSFLDEDTLQNS